MDYNPNCFIFFEIMSFFCLSLIRDLLKKIQAKIVLIKRQSCKPRHLWSYTDTKVLSHLPHVPTRDLTKVVAIRAIHSNLHTVFWATFFFFRDWDPRESPYTHEKVAHSSGKEARMSQKKAHPSGKGAHTSGNKWCTQVQTPAARQELTPGNLHTVDGRSLLKVTAIQDISRLLK